MMMKYMEFTFFGFSDDFIQSKKLEKVAVDSENWLTFYQNEETKWIEFYPFSEYHAGGIPYIINIGTNDFEDWIKRHKDFVTQIRVLIETKVQ